MIVTYMSWLVLDRSSSPNSLPGWPQMLIYLLMHDLHTLYNLLLRSRIFHLHGLQLRLSRGHSVLQMFYFLRHVKCWDIDLGRRTQMDWME